MEQTFTGTHMSLGPDYSNHLGKWNLCVEANDSIFYHHFFPFTSDHTGCLLYDWVNKFEGQGYRLAARKYVGMVALKQELDTNQMLPGNFDGTLQ